MDSPTGATQTRAAPGCGKDKGWAKGPPRRSRLFACRLESGSGININPIIPTLEQLSGSRLEAEPSDDVRNLSIRLLRVHNPRAADATQLAEGIIASDGRPQSLSFVSRDERLSRAAEKEGFPVL